MSTSSSTPSSPPPPPARPFPLFALPSELVQTIIESTIPLHYHSEIYSSRQATLRTLCLVSKLFHQIAKPLLFAVVQLRDLKQTERWEKELDRGGLRALSREIVVYPLRWSSLDAIVRDHFALKVLIVHSYSRNIDLSTVAALSNLSTLRVCSTRIYASSPVRLHRLHELSLFQVEFTDDASELINSTTVPSLRLFAYYQEEGPLLGISATLRSLQPQLELVSLEAWTATTLDADLSEALNPITLCDIRNEDDLSRIPLRYVRYDREDSLDTVEEALENFIDRIESTPSDRLPSALYLPLPADFEGYHEPEDAEIFERLADVCDEYSVELVYEKSPVWWFLNSGFSPHFSARIQNAKKKRIE